MFKKYFVFLVTVVLFFNPKLGYGDENLPINPKTLEQYFDKLGSQGLSATVLIVKKNKVLFRRAYGAARDEPYAAMTPETLIDIGSLGKQFTATLIIQLAEEGLLSLDDTIGQFFPAAPEDKAEITLHQLLNHSSGLTSHDTGNDFDPMTKKEALNRIFDLELIFPPGTQYGYSNAGYVMLAIIVEKITGEDYLPLIKARFFDPLGMTHTASYGDQVLKENPTAYGYRSKRETASFAEAAPLQWGAKGAGEILSTIDDMRLWMEALRDGIIISPEYVQMLWAPHINIGFPEIFYGYGWRIRTESPLGKRVEHGGLGHGGNSSISYFPEHDLLMMILSNRGGINFVDGRVIGVKQPAARAMQSLINVIATNDPTIEADVSIIFD